MFLNIPMLDATKQSYWHTIMNIAIISGSARENNNTLRVGKAIQLIAQSKGHHCALVDFQAYDIPLINQGNVDIDNLSPFQQQLFASMQMAQLVIIITPEYNWSTTPEILNFLHRLGDPKYTELFHQKTFATVGVSTGKGGKAPALHLHTILNKIISFSNFESIVSPKIFESHFTKEVLNENGESLGNMQYDNGLDNFVTYTLRAASRWSSAAISGV